MKVLASRLTYNAQQNILVMDGRKFKENFTCFLSGYVVSFKSLLVVLYKDNYHMRELTCYTLSILPQYPADAIQNLR